MFYTPAVNRLKTATGFLFGAHPRTKVYFFIFTVKLDGMKINDIIGLLQQIAPLAYAEDFDNTGLLVGNGDREVTGILVTLDTLEAVVDEAVKKECNFIVSFHPIIFSGLKKLTGRTYVERVIEKAIKNDIAIFAIHTALDNQWNGVNAMISEKLKLENRAILLPKKDSIKKLVTYVPKKEADTVRNAMFEAGAGNIGNYSNCSFNTEGSGSSVSYTHLTLPTIYSV